MQILKTKRWAMAVLLVVLSVMAVDAAASSRTTRRFVRYYDAISQSETKISFFEQVVYTLFFTEAGTCPSQKPRGLRPS